MDNTFEFSDKDKETVNEFSDLLKRFGIKSEYIIPFQFIRYSIDDTSCNQSNSTVKTSSDANKNSHAYPTLNEIERRHIAHTLKLCDGECKMASKLLGINRTTLYRKIKKYGIDKINDMEKHKLTN